MSTCFEKTLVMFLCLAQLRIAQQALGGKDDLRARLADQRLAAQQMEVLGGGGRVGDPDGPLGAEGQEALDAGAGVLRAGAPRSRGAGAV